MFRRFSGRSTLQLYLLAALVVLPVAVYAGSLDGLLSFMNGEVADANAVNANVLDAEIEINDNDTRVLTLEGLLSQSCPANKLVAGFDANGVALCQFSDVFGGILGTPLGITFSPLLLIDQILIEVLDQWLTDPTISLAIDITGINGGFEFHGNDVVNVIDTNAFTTDGQVAQTVVDWTTDTVTQNMNEVYTVCVQVRRNTTQLIGAQKCQQFGPF